MLKRLENWNPHKLVTDGQFRLNLDDILEWYSYITKKKSGYFKRVRGHSGLSNINDDSKK